jgi:UDPglucose--hexose-1-phosphate uridylyltransferase
MPELRYNLLVRDWVIIATGRAKRPHDFIKAKKEIPPIPEYRDNCPFCPRNESLSPPETFRLGDAKVWRTRVVPNKFPALSSDEEIERKTDGIFNSVSGFGVHEVIVENPRHNTLIALMSDKEVEDIIRTYKTRYLSLSGKEHIEAIIIFKNHGPAAGTSLEHPHSQLIATPIVPPQIRSRLEHATRYFDTTGKCVGCFVLEQELKAKARVVIETDGFAVFMPYASFVPFQMLVLPKRHMASFADINDSEIFELASVLKIALSKLYRGLDNPDFNYTIRSIPVHENGEEYFHWYLSILPRLTQPAGFELGSGMFINTALPEEAAEFLRNIKC